MIELILKLVRYRGQYVVLGRNSAMKMLLAKGDGQVTEIVCGK